MELGILVGKLHADPGSGFTVLTPQSAAEATDCSAHESQPQAHALAGSASCGVGVGEARSVVLHEEHPLGEAPVVAEADVGGPLGATVPELLGQTRVVEARKALLEAPLSELEKSEDPWVQLAVVLEQWDDQQREQELMWEGALLRLRPAYLQALRETRSEAAYSDANGTLRVSWGQVKGYSPAEAVTYGAQTTVRGMLAKDTGKAPFALPVRVQTAVGDAPVSPYADKALGTVPVCFLSTLENIGGNSGSPTLDAKGRVVGLAFDRNYEGMAAEWRFEPERTRSIHVDIRFVLWMLDLDGAESVLDELGVR